MNYQVIFYQIKNNKKKQLYNKNKRNNKYIKNSNKILTKTTIKNL